MPNKTVVVRVGVDPTAGIAGLDRLDRKARQTGKSISGSLDGATAALGRNHEAAGRVANGMLTVGVAAGAALIASGVAAVQWESQFAGVRKTVDDNAAGFAVLEGELRGLARTLPSTHAEIAGVAEAAGQLGIERKSITGFTKTMIDLGETTNLSAGEASTSLAQFMNIMGTSQQEVSRLGSTLVDLGNNGASTEKDIATMGLRIAGAGKQVGLTEAEVLAFASTLSSLGIEAEAGGSAISRTMIKIDQAVRSGGAQLELLGEITGQTGQQFKESFQKDAAGAINDVVLGLGKMSGAGKNTTEIMNRLNITEIRETDALRRLAAATKAAGGQQDLLSEQLKIGSRAWEENTALIEEANKRYDTAASKAQVAWNVIKDEAISAGQAMLPVIAQIFTGITALGNVIGGLPEPVKDMTGSLVGAVAVVALLGGGAIKAATSIGAMRAAMTLLGISAKVAGRALRIAGLSIPVIGIAIFAITEAIAHFTKETADSKGEVETFDAAIQTLTGDVDRNTAAMSENVRAATIQNLQQRGALDLAEKLGLSVRTVTEATLGNKDAIAEVNRVIAESLALNATASEGDADRRQAAIDLGQALNGVAHAEIEAINAARQRKEANEGATQSQRDYARQAGLTVEEVVELGRAQDDLAKAESNLATETRKMRNELTLLKDGALDAESANLAWEESIDAARDSIKENGKELDSGTEKGRANRQSIIGMIKSLNDKTVSDIKNGDSTKKVTKRYEENRAQLIKVATEMGLTKKQATKMIDEFLSTPEQLKTKIKTEGMKDVLKQIEILKKKIKALEDKTVKINFRTGIDGYKTSFVGEYFGKKPKAEGGYVDGYATGGAIKGRGGPKQDNVMGIDPITGMQTSWVSVGEFVVNAEATKRNRALIEAINAGKINPGTSAVDGFARGGRLNNGPLNRGRRLNHGPTEDVLINTRGSADMGDAAGIYQTMTNRFASNMAGKIGKDLEKYAKAEAARAAAAAAIKTGGGDGGYKGSVPGGAAGIRRIARALGATYIAAHRDPQGGPAFDLGSSGAKNNRIANALRTNHGKLGARYVISQMRIASARSGWGWRGYSPITGSGDFRHVNHVHISYPCGGMVSKPKDAISAAQSLGIRVRTYDGGGLLPVGATLALNRTRGPEIVHNPAQPSLVRSYAAGGSVSRSSAAAPVIDVQLVALVENPWTGEQMRARVVSITDGRIDTRERRNERRFD